MLNENFDPLAAVVDWLDAGREGRLDDLLDMYDANASLECGCDGPYVYRGRADLNNYWSSRLAKAAPRAFTMTDVLLGENPECVVLDYLSYEGLPVRVHFRFAPSGKIAATVCGPAKACPKAA